MQQVHQTARATAQQATSPLDAADRPCQLRGWFTVKQLAGHLQFPSAKACRAWLTRQGIVSVRRGRIILVDGWDVEAALHGAQRRTNRSARRSN